MSEVTNETAVGGAGRRYPKGFAWFAVGAVAVAAALCVPTARDVIHTQVYGLAGIASVLPTLFQSADSQQKENEVRQKAEAARHPDDVAMQVSLTLPRTTPSYETGANETSLRESLAEANRLRDLGEKFPNSAVPQAALLIRLSETAVTANRPEQHLLSPPSKQPKPGTEKEKSPFTDTPDALTLFHEAANRGAALEQDNAFFPTMQVLGFLAAHQDEDAIAALKRAANCPKWNEHTGDVTGGRLRLIDGVNGVKTPVMATLAVSAAELYPHYAILRQLARTMTALAVQKELAGDKEGGLRIRMDLAHVGEKLRLDSRNLIGSLVGVAVTAISSARPGGMPLSEGKMNSDERTAKSLTDYTSYLKANGYDKEAIWYVAERQKGNDVKAATKGGLDNGIFGLRWIAGNAAGWGVGYLLLLNLALALLVGGVSEALLRRLPSDAKIPAWAWAVGGVAALTLLALGAFLCSASIAQATAFIYGVSGVEGNGSGLESFVGIFIVGTLLLVGFVCGGVTYAVRAKRSGRAVGLSVLRGYRDDTLKAVGACLLVYAVSAIFTGWSEAKIAADMTEMRQHEGRYLAKISNAEWPGKVGERKQL